MIIQKENIKMIHFLETLLIKMKHYGLDAQSYELQFSKYCKEYEQKRNQKNSKSIHLELEPDYEKKLFLELSELQENLFYPILLIRLMEDTKNWNINISYDTFDTIERRLPEILKLYASLNTQEEIIQRYYHYLLKKIIYDYQNDKETYQNYPDLINDSFFINSLTSFLEEKQMKLEQPISNYEIETILKIITHKEIQMIEEEPKEETERSLFLMKLLKQMVENQKEPLTYLGQKKEEIIAKIGLKKAKRKDFREENLEGMDLSSVDFSDILLYRTNLRNTHANINPENIRNAEMKYCNLEGLNLLGLDFSKINVQGTNLNQTGAYLDFTKNKENLENTYYEGCFIKIPEGFSPDSTDVTIVQENPKDTLSYLGPNALQIIQKIGGTKAIQKDFRHQDFHGYNLSDVDFTDVWVVDCNLSDTYANIDPQKVRDRDLTQCNLEKINLIGKNLTGVKLISANLSNTGAWIPYTESYFYSSYESPNLNGCYGSEESLIYRGVTIVPRNPLSALEYLQDACFEVYKRIGAEAVYHQDFRAKKLDYINLSNADLSNVLLDNKTSLKNTNARITKEQARILYPGKTDFAFLEDLKIYQKDQIENTLYLH